MTKKRLRVLFCDHLNLARGKYLPGDHAGGGESRFCQGVFALTYDKDLLPAPCSTLLEGLPDMVAKFDGQDIRKGWHDGDDVVIADLYDTKGQTLPVCGRSLLKRTIDEWKVLGYTPKVGIELEAYAYTRDDSGEWQPYDTPGAFVYSTGPLSDPAGFTDAIWQRAEETGFSLEMITTEFDSPQFEFTLRFDDALKAVDDIFLFRLMAREVAMEYGILLTFMPKPIPEISGSGVHVNFSLWDDNGVNQIGDSQSADNLSDLGRRCVAGLMHHHRGLSGILAPTVNSYARLQPASLSGYWRNWGSDHRGVTTRITTETGALARIEHRMPDGACNPYTMVATVLQAALLGFRNDYALVPAETADCLETHDAEDGVPDNLAGALEALQQDQALIDAVGSDLVGNLMVLKSDEIEKTAELDQKGLLDFYMHYI
ncbi:MAG: glutamine synthetase [Gammaproteobacteria bacterium]|nr:glutamine synthetase [Gammaproteobacteria bacterium]